MNSNNNDKCSYCRERNKLMFDYYKRNADEEGKYTTIVFSLGYVTMLTTYSSFYKHLELQPKAIFIVFLFLSLFPFIINEVWKMIMNHLENKQENELWVLNGQNKISLDELEQLSRNYQSDLYKKYETAYPFVFYTSLIFGVLAALVLFLEAIYATF